MYVTFEEWTGEISGHKNARPRQNIVDVGFLLNALVKSAGGLLWIRFVRFSLNTNANVKLYSHKLYRKTNINMDMFLGWGSVEISDTKKCNAIPINKQIGN